MLLSVLTACLSDRAVCIVCRKCNIADMGWRKEEPLKEMLIDFCVHGHFYREEGNTNGVYGAWWAPLDLLIEKVGKEAMEKHCSDFFESAQTNVTNLFACEDSPGEEGD